MARRTRQTPLRAARLAVVRLPHTSRARRQELAARLSFLDTPPTDAPAPLSYVGAHPRIDTLLSGVPFETYIILDNFFQGFLHTKDEALLRECGHYLYSGSSHYLPEHITSILYWLVSLKACYAKKYPHFFRPAPTADSTSSGAAVEDAMKVQIRALTPNGFGIAGNSNIAPASKERVERLCREFETERDTAVGSLFALLTTYDAWLTTAVGDWFAATLHPDFASLCRKVGETLSWDKYQELRARLMLLESDIAHTHISPELYDALRREQLSQRFTHAYRKQVAEHLRTIEANALTGLPLATASLADLVQFLTNEQSSEHTHQSCHLPRVARERNCQIVLSTSVRE